MLFVLCGSVIATGLILTGSTGEAVAFLLVFVLLAGVHSPLVPGAPPPKVEGRPHGLSRSAALPSERDEGCYGDELCTIVALAQRMDHPLQDPERV